MAGRNRMRRGGQRDPRSDPPRSFGEDVERLHSNRVCEISEPPVSFPKATLFCRLCHSHFDGMTPALDHLSTSDHTLRMTVLRLRAAVLAAPADVHRVLHQPIQQEIESIFHEGSMTPQSELARLDLLAFLQATVTFAVQNQPPLSDLTVELCLHGSSVSGVAFKDSDVNLDMRIKRKDNGEATDSDRQADAFWAVCMELERTQDISDVSLLLPQAAGLRAYDRKRCLKFVLTLNCGAHRESPGYKTAALLRRYIRRDPRVTRLAFYFRHWGRLLSLDDPDKGGLPPRAFAIMTVFFCQQTEPPLLPCFHDSQQKGAEKTIDELFQPFEGWQSTNRSSEAQLLYKMMKFYAAEFRMRKLAVCIRTREPVSLASLGWNARCPGIEDPYSRKVSLGKSMFNDKTMTFFISSLRYTFLLLAFPRVMDAWLFLPPQVLNLDIVEDPDGDDIEDGLACASRAPVVSQVTLDDQDAAQSTAVVSAGDGESIQITGSVACGDDSEIPPGVQSPAESTPSVDQTAASARGSAILPNEDPKPFRNLRGWNQTLPPQAEDVLMRHEGRLLFSLGDSEALAGHQKPPVCCVFCKAVGHAPNKCGQNKYPQVMRFSPADYVDRQNRFTTMAGYVWEKHQYVESSTNQERQAYVRDVEARLRTSLANANLKLFGSSRNGFCLRSADLDICLTFDDREDIADVDEVRRIIIQVAKILLAYDKVDKVTAVTNAKVPIVKFIYKPAGLEADISLYNVLAEHNTRLLKAYSLIDARVPALGMMFKLFVKNHDICDASKGSLSSYAYTIMLIRYLQVEGVLPVLQEIPPIGHPKDQPLPTRMVAGWNTYFFDDLANLNWPLWNKKTVGQLWLGLIDYYATVFAYDCEVITIRRLRPLSRVSKMWMNKMIVIEDPFELDHNLGVGIQPKMGVYIRSTFIRARNRFLETQGHPFRPDPQSMAEAYSFYFEAGFPGVKGPPSTFGCKHCRAVGHWIKDCPKLKESRLAPKACRICGETTHLAKKCPRAKRGLVETLNELCLQSPEPGTSGAQRMDVTKKKGASPTGESPSPGPSPGRRSPRRNQTDRRDRKKK